MSFLDKVTRAVGDVVDRGKKEVDQFVRIQRINGEIGDMERKIAEFRSQIGEAKVAAGEKAIELVRSGALAAPDLRAFAEKVTAIEQQIAAEEAAIAGKRADIEKIRAEHEAEQAAAATPTNEPAAPAQASSSPADQPTSTPALRCAQCGAELHDRGLFCPQCGAKRLNE